MCSTVDRFSFSRFPNEGFLDLRLYQYGWEQCAPQHTLGPFICNHYLFHYVISGGGELEADDREGVCHRYTLEADQGFLLCPGQAATYHAHHRGPWKYAWLEFDGLRAAEYLSSAGLGFTQPIYHPQTVSQGQAVRDTMLYIAQHSQASSLHLTGHLCLFLDRLIESASARRELHGGQLRDYYIQEAVNFMEHNYQREVTVEEMADVCQLNRSYFSKIFKESKGCPPQEYLIRLRLSKAANLMRSTSNSIADVSALCGYPNQLHFSRAFKKRYGLSPREWRLQNRI